jgi:large subunit ribosomal protein L22
MGARKRLKAEQLKAQNKQLIGAKLNNCPTSPRKMRLVVDIIRGIEVNKALGILRFSKKAAAGTLERLLKSAISNWETNNTDNRHDLEDGNVIVRTITVDSARMLKRISPAPQGRAYRIRKRSNHINIVLDTLIKPKIQEETTSVVTENSDNQTIES